MRAVPFGHPAWIEIDLQQLRLNLAIIKHHVGPTKILFPVKANAYGHGLVETARAVADQVDYLGVSCLQEGILLRQENIRKPILVLGAIHIEQIAELIYYDMEITISSLYKAKLVAEACRAIKQPVKIHLEIDTGMQRTGVRIATASAIIDFIRSQELFTLSGVYSHLATADDPDSDFSVKQIKEFIDFLHAQKLLDDPNVLCHLANSSGVACYPETHLDMVRPGLLAYGYYPRADLPTDLLEIKPCFSLRSKVSYFKTILRGQGVSYNHTHIADKQTRMLTIPVGYGDGYRRALSNKAEVILNGKRYPVVGNICMDQCMVDIGDDDGYVGDIVTLIGKDKNMEIRLEEISKACDTITYEVLCGFSERLPRIYVENEK